MYLENRTRITLLLPSPTTPDQHVLVNNVITSLIKICNGVTVSSDSPPVFAGWWIDNNSKQLVQDVNLLILADAPVPLEDDDLMSFVVALKIRCQKDFEQDIIWLTLHSIGRVNTDDYQKD
jgi:hypothetical protein